MTPLAALAVCRFGQAAGASLLWGASAYLWALVPGGLGHRVAARLRTWGRAAAMVAAFATLVRLPAEVAGITGGWDGAADPRLVGLVLEGTANGRAWLGQAAAALLLLLASGPASPGRRLPACALASGLLLAALSASGHAAARDGAAGLLASVVAVLHALSAGAWLGALVPVMLILGPSGQAPCAAARAALRGFSRAGHLAVVAVLLSGAASTALAVGGWPTDPVSPYQALLRAKIAAVLGMVGLALANRYVLLPALPRLPGAGRSLRAATLAEVALGVLALALVAVFGLLDPG